MRKINKFRLILLINR